MGVVYRAQQKEPVERIVALKLIHTILKSPTTLIRFTAERQAMARLSHPNIAMLYEAGATEGGFPYFAMELVPGDELTTHCDNRRLGIEERLELFVQVCSGVQHAHQKGIIHRDLKPSNLLVANVEGQAIPKVIDFGVAKALDEPLTDAEGLTRLQWVGTSDYMSPEALANSVDLDTRTDIYSLGVVLYELLCGVRTRIRQRSEAFVGTSRDWVQPIAPSARLNLLDERQTEKIAKERGLKVGELAVRLKGDLDWIVMKALDREPERRYASAAEMAADIKRHLTFEPVIAGPPSRAYRIRRFVQRHRLGVAATSMVLAALVLGFAGTTIGLLRAQKAEAEARLEAQRSEAVAGFMTELFEVSDPGEARGNSVTARELLDRAAGHISSRLSDQPLLQARLMGTMGDVYGKLGLYGDAVALEEKTLGLREARLGPEDPEVAQSLNALGTLYRHQARYQDAENLINRALQIRDRAFGRSSPEYAESLNSLASVEVMLGQNDRAEELYRAAIAIREQMADRRPEDLATSLHDLGWLMANRNRFEDAESLLLRALQLRISLFGEDHYDVAQSEALLAYVYTNAGRYDEAEDYDLRALETRRKALGPDHPAIAESELALGALHRVRGEYEEADRWLQSALDLFERTLGADHLNVARVLGEMGLSFYDQGRWAESEPLYRRQLEIYRTALGPDHALVGEAMVNLGWALSDGTHQYESGEAVLHQAIRLFDQLDDKPYWQALARWNLANNLRDQSRYSEADPYYREAMEILERIGGADRANNPDLEQLMQDYGKLLQADGRISEATPLQASLANNH